MYHGAQATSSTRSFSSRRWSETVATDEYSEDFPGDFEFANASIATGWTLQDLTNVDMHDPSHSMGGLSPQSVFAVVRRIEATSASP